MLLILQAGYAQACEIKGKAAPYLNNTYVYKTLYKSNGDKIRRDSVNVRNGKFKFEVSCNMEEWHQLEYINISNVFNSFSVVMDVKTIEINLSDSSHTVNGSPLHDLYKEFQKRIGNIQNANEKQEFIENYSGIIEQNNNNRIGQIMYERLLVRLTSPNDSVLFYKVYNSGSEAWKKNIDILSEGLIII